jgi:cysteine synthase A
MTHIYLDNALSIGNTPLVKLNTLAKKAKGEVLVKVEGRNPAYSVKCRVGANLIRDAEERGLLKKGMTVIEPTSGNTGIALAFVCAAKGYRIALTMPSTMSLERQKLLKAFGAEVILTPGGKGMRGALDEAARIAGENPGSYFLPNQFTNPANPEIHFMTTGPEIYADTGGRVDYFVAGVGTGGTITGVGKYLKEEMKLDVTTVAVEPASSPVLSGGTPGLHKIQGIGAGFKPAVLDMRYVDKVMTVTDGEAYDTARRLAREEGIISGISSGAAVAAALKIAGSPSAEGKIIVAILPDSGERYLSTDLFGD